MPEIRNLTYGESFTYKGLINVKELYALIDKWFKDHGYEKNELWNFEEVYEDGKQITLKLEPYRKISDYAKITIRMTVHLRKLQEVIVEKKDLKLKLMKGDARFVFDTFIVTDYEGHWETKPFYFFVKTIAEKFLYKSYIDRYEEVLLRDKDMIKRELKSFLNMQRF